MFQNLKNRIATEASRANQAILSTVLQTDNVRLLIKCLYFYTFDLRRNLHQETQVFEHHQLVVEMKIIQ